MSAGNRQKQDELESEKIWILASEVILAVGLDGHIRGGVGHAGEAEAIAGLVLIEEGLVGLVDGAIDDLARAAGAGAGAAGVGQLDALLLSLVQDVDILGALEG